MGAKTEISWCDATFNPWWGCTKVGGSPECEHCYAETWANRTGFKIWGDDQPRRFFGDKHWNEPLKWSRDAEKAGIRKRVFCMSMGDWAEGRPDQAESLLRLWELIQATPWLDWLMLTKRPQLISKLCPLPYLWQGTTTGTQKWLDIRWKFLREVDARVHWLSVEPLFEEITLPDSFLALGSKAWCIVGGESSAFPTGSAKSKPLHPQWVRRLRDQCGEASVPFHFKQYGDWRPRQAGDPDNQPQIRLTDRGEDGQDLSSLGGNDVWMQRVGKKAAGCLLDGVEHKEFPA